MLVGGNVSGKPNFITIGLIGWLCYDVLPISVGHQQDSKAGLLENGTFSINRPTAELVKKLDRCGVASGREADKAALFETFYGDLETAPMIRECRVIETLTRKVHMVFLGEVVAVYADESVLIEGIPTIERIKLIFYAPDPSRDRRAYGCWGLGERPDTPLRSAGKSSEASENACGTDGAARSNAFREPVCEHSPLAVGYSNRYPTGGRGWLAMPRDCSNLVWIDLETTGLSVSRHAILEIASLVTDRDLHIVGTGPDLVVHQPDEVLHRLDPWCKKQHGFSGLIESSRASDISLHEAEQQTLTFLRRHSPRKASPLCGNSILLDRRFLMHYMSELNGHLSHRNLDVSSISELAHRWYPGAVARLDKEFRHRAAKDVRASIEELRFYRQHIFKA